MSVVYIGVVGDWNIGTGSSLESFFQESLLLIFSQGIQRLLNLVNWDAKMHRQSAILAGSDHTEQSPRTKQRR